VVRESTGSGYIRHVGRRASRTAACLAAALRCASVCRFAAARYSARAARGVAGRQQHGRSPQRRGSAFDARQSPGSNHRILFVALAFTSTGPIGPLTRTSVSRGRLAAGQIRAFIAIRHRALPRHPVSAPRHRDRNRGSSPWKTARPCRPGCSCRDRRRSRRKAAHWAAAGVAGGDTAASSSNVSTGRPTSRQLAFYRRKATRTRRNPSAS
jgi:hypothetical protein